METFNINTIQMVFCLIFGILLIGAIINFIGLKKINKEIFLWGEGISIFSFFLLSFYTIIYFHDLPGYVGIFIILFSVSLFLTYRFIKNEVLFKGQFWFNEKLLVKFHPHSFIKWRKKIIYLDVNHPCQVDRIEMKGGKPFYTITLLIKGKPRFDEVPETYLSRP